MCRHVLTWAFFRKHRYSKGVDLSSRNLCSSPLASHRIVIEAHVIAINLEAMAKFIRGTGEISAEFNPHPDCIVSGPKSLKHESPNPRSNWQARQSVTCSCLRTTCTNTYMHTYIQTDITLHYTTLHYITLHYNTLHACVPT